MFFGSASGAPGLKNQAFGKGSITRKTTLKAIGFLMITGFIFSRCCVALEPMFMTFVALEIGLKFDDFSR